MKVALIAIEIAMKHVQNSTKAIYIYIDSTGVINRILNSKVGPLQKHSISACKKIRKFLTNRPDRSIHLHWVPSHSDIELDKLVDQIAKKGSKQP